MGERMRSDVPVLTNFLQLILFIFDIIIFIKNSLWWKRKKIQVLFSYFHPSSPLSSIFSSLLLQNANQGKSLVTLSSIFHPPNLALA